MTVNKGMYSGVVVAVLGLSAAAQANSQNTWFESPGETCQALADIAADRGGYFVGQTWNPAPGIYNPDQIAWWVCPIQLVKDSDLISPGPVTVGDITFVLVDRNARSNDFSCFANLYDEAGGLWQSPTIYTPPGRLDVWQRFTIWDPFSGKNLDLAHYSGNSLVLMCTVPEPGTVGTKVSGLIMYRASFEYDNLP